jgi:hypothetical protein
MDEVIVKLSQAEAMVLFELLARNDDDNAIAIMDQAERTVLWRLEGQLEKQVTELFSPDYLDHLAEAKISLVE